MAQKAYLQPMALHYLFQIRQVLISNLLNIAALSDSSGRNQTDLLATANNLFDSNLGTITDFRAKWQRLWKLYYL